MAGYMPSRRFQELLSGKIGKMNGFKAKIHVKDGAVPKFCKPRKVAFALQEGVNRELKRLEDNGIIESLAYAD